MTSLWAATLKIFGRRPIAKLSSPKPVELPAELVALMARLNTLADNLEADREGGLTEIREAREAVAALLPALVDARVGLARAVEAANAMKSEPIDLSAELRRLMPTTPPADVLAASGPITARRRRTSRP